MNEYVDALDRSLADAGEDIIIRRKAGSGANQVNVDVKCRARVDWKRSEQMVGAVFQTWGEVILSPTQILAAQWPGGVYDGPVISDVDPRIPRSTDYAVIQGKQRQLLTSKPFFINGLVRLELTVAG